MPKILDDRVKAIMRSGKTKSQSFAIATAQLQKEGKLKKGTRKLARKKNGKK